MFTLVSFAVDKPKLDVVPNPTDSESDYLVTIGKTTHALTDPQLESLKQLIISAQIERDLERGVESD